MSARHMQSGAVFRRHETKYRIPNTAFTAFAQALSHYLKADEYGLHTISSLYFDTGDYSIIRASLDKPNYKEKLRLRSYGVPGPEDIVYLELKKKFDGVTYKRRVALSHRDAVAYLDRGVPPARQDQIFQEIQWFVQRHRPAPKVLLSCDRLALYTPDDPQLRVTLDRDIRWRDYNLELSKGDYGSLLLEPGARLMEIKTGGALPLWMVSLLSEHRIYPCSFSKYGTVYTQRLLPGEDTRHVG